RSGRRAQRAAKLLPDGGFGPGGRGGREARLQRGGQIRSPKPGRLRVDGEPRFDLDWTVNPQPQIDTRSEGIPVAKVAYGDGRIALRMDPRIADWRAIAPTHEPAMEDPRAAFVAACRRPIGSAPLRELIGRNDRV